MTTETKIIIGLILALGAFNFYLYSDTQEELRRQAQTGHVQCPDNHGTVAALTQAQRNQLSMVASHTYFELLLEGIARRLGLPLDRARSAFEAEVKANKPPSWKWLDAWEGAAPASSSSAPAPLKDIKPNGNLFNDR